MQFFSWRPAPRARRRSALAALGALALAASGCAAGPDPVVFAAPSSFTDVAPRLADAYAASHPGARPTITLGSSAQLVQQANAGTAPDVLVTADERAPDALVDPGAYESFGFAASNALVLVAGEVPPQDDDFAAWLPEARLALCAPDVPCGRAADAWLARHGLQAAVADASLEANVRQVLTKVSSGQADAGFVYATDAATDESLQTVALDGDANRYPVLVGEGDAARSFGEWLLGDEAQEILRGAGFGEGAAG
ncbi:molybdate ABC transporter substrate-binding protein [Zhihengliuella salsuginis]|uniref:Molybdate ABC transporter substrate-binding protein n=1 Tax=Zhihengliuella salsuginis TaxID=578222 RepID=A0ABQ3GIV6_9MICC|nr:molybdate ABC transporter substrate-binding protein [Zhihengliuella salsuginis]GHD07395.1 molybdate ABC transporter substrate-binding protein [Zhihengliuella salsuginis]